MNPPVNGGKTPAQLLQEWVPPGSAGAPPPMPEQAPPPMQEPGTADRILAMLRGVEPFKTILDKILTNPNRADRIAP
jgi:hypothetical protein